MRIEAGVGPTDVSRAGVPETVAEIEAAEGLRQVKAGHGRPFDVAGVHFLWKAKGEDTENAFTVVEQTLSTGEGVPPHSHPYAEFFYVLEGVVHFRRVGPPPSDLTELRCAAGDAVIVAANTVHAFSNMEQAPARVLGVSNYLHQTFFDGVQAADTAERFGAMDPGAAMARIAEIGQEHSMFFAPPNAG
jgi:quercetin dioxygenase-like cupin family protein